MFCNENSKVIIITYSILFNILLLRFLLHKYYIFFLYEKKNNCSHKLRYKEYLELI